MVSLGLRRSCNQVQGRWRALHFPRRQGTEKLLRRWAEAQTSLTYWSMQARQ